MAKKSPKNTTFTGKVKKKAQVGINNLTGQGLDITPISSGILDPIGPIRTYTPQQRAEMERFAKMSPKKKQREKDKYAGFVTPPSPVKSPSLETRGYTDVKRGEELPQIDLNQQQTLEAGEIESNVPPAVQQAQDLNKKELGSEKARNPFENVKWNDALDATTLGLFGVNAFLNKQQAIRDQENYQRRLRNVFTQKPIYDYNYLYGPDSSGGTQYQNLIMAKNGAEIRRGTSPDITDVEVEGGEFIQLPDLSTQHVEGPSHAQGGVHTNLPEGARVFSDYLKPIGSKKTYAQIAKKYDTEKYREVLENPYANDIDRRTASLLFRKYESILNELFEDQQKQNGNSNGTDQALGMEEEEAMGKFGLDLKKGEKLSFTNPFMHGGYYQEGGEYELPYADENNLFQVYNPYNAYNNFNEYAPAPETVGMDNMENYQIGGQYTGGEAYLDSGGYAYEDGGFFPANSTYYPAPSNDASVLNLGTDVEGDAYFADGGIKGKRRVQQIRTDYQDTPPYEYKNESIPSMKERLTDALVRWNLDSKENLEKVKNASTIAELGKIAGTMQKKVAAEQSAVAEDFGFRTPPTRSGFRFLADLGDAKLKEILEDDKLVKAVKGAKGGSYTLTPQERTLITQRIQQNLPSSLKKDYSVANFQDEEFYYRYPRVEQVEFDNEEEYKDYLKNVNVGGKYVADEKLGLYIEPVYNKPKDKPKEEEEEQSTEGNEYPGVTPFQQTPSTPGVFPAYQGIPEAMGFLSGINPYTYYTPDFTHTEIAPPTLNIDPQLQSIDDSLQSTLRQSTGNASVDASRRAALFNQALGAKQQAFANKQNYDAQARFQADQYNAQARDLESYRDVSSAANIYNEYMAGAQDAAEQERLRAIASLVKKKALFDQDEFQKMLYVSALMPNFYYEGTDLRNPIKLNPYAQDFYSRMANRQSTSKTKSKDKSKETKTPEVNTATTPAAQIAQAALVNPAVAANVLNLPQNPLYSWGQPQMNPNIAYPNFEPIYNMAGYTAVNPDDDYTIVPEIEEQQLPYSYLGEPSPGNQLLTKRRATPGYDFNRSNKFFKTLVGSKKVPTRNNQ